jgi:protein gp37
MAESSKIAWTDNTVNVWIGCQEVRLGLSAAQATLVKASGGVVVEETTADGRVVFFVPSECDGCYARTFVTNRMGYNGTVSERPVVWGNPKTTPRIQTKYWRAALRRWNVEAAKSGRLLVFSFSLSDWAEEHPALRPWRDEFLRVVEECENLDFQLLTKRPQNILRMVPESWRRAWPKNVWVGTSAGTQRAWDLRVPYLYDVRAAGAPVCFVSMEPLLELVIPDGDHINWIITGGESGNGSPTRARMDADPNWFRLTRIWCAERNVAFFHKQGSGARPGTNPEIDGRLWHQFPLTDAAVPSSVGGVRALPNATLVGPISLLA